MTWATVRDQCLREAELEGSSADHQQVAMDIGDEIVRDLCHKLSFQEFLQLDVIYTLPNTTDHFVDVSAITPRFIRLAEDRLRFISTPDSTNPVWNQLRPANPRQRSLIVGTPHFYTLAGNKILFYPYSEIAIGQQILYSYYPLYDIATDFLTADIPDKILSILKPALMQRLLLYKDSKKAQAWSGVAEQRIKDVL